MDIDKTLGYEKKKISVDIDKRIDDILEELGDLTNSNKSMIITAIFKDGLPLFVDYLIDNWQFLLSNPSYENKKEKIKEQIKKAKEIKKKIYWRQDTNLKDRR